MKFAILDRNPKIADDKMKIKRTWLPKNPSAYKDDAGRYSVEASSFHYLKKKHPEVDMDLLPFEDITDLKKMKKYKKIFIFNHGLSDERPFWKNNATKYKKAWKALGSRVWPSYAFASLILDKCAYYKFLQSKKVVTADTFCFKKNSKLANLKKFIKGRKIRKVFIKPVGGNSGVGTSTHEEPFEGLNGAIQKGQEEGWNKLVIQRFMNFSTHDSPEYKCLYVGGELQYIVKTFRLGFFEGVIMPNDTWWPHLKKVDMMSRRVIQMFEKRTRAPIPFCRVDWGYDKQNKRFFLNEFEHAGGTYGEDMVHNQKQLTPKTWQVDVKLAQAILKVIRNFKSASIKGGGTALPI